MCLTCVDYIKTVKVYQKKKLKNYCVWKINFGPIRQGPEEDILFTRFALNV